MLINQEDDNMLLEPINDVEKLLVIVIVRVLMIHEIILWIIAPTTVRIIITSLHQMKLQNLSIIVIKREI